MDARLNNLHSLIREVTGHSPYEQGFAVRGAGGGGGKGGSSGGSSATTPDTLFSTATIRMVDLLGEGEIVGVKGGLKGVYLNDIPVQNADNSFNFKGVTAEFRNGTADQPYMAGYPDVQTPKSVGVKATQQTSVVASISETEATRVRVTLQFPALFLAKNDGSVANNSVQYRVEARYSGGPWVNQIGDQTLTGKTTSGYFRSHDLNLPINPAGVSAPWQVRLTRISADTEDFNNRQNKYTNQSDVIFYSTTSITDAKFTYGNSAVTGLTAQASLFGSSVPGRTYFVDGALMAVPSNYDPVARTYSGIWDGTFKQAFSNNPAWALYLVLSNDRFGLGDVIDSAAIDKFSLYEIGRYCDVMVSDGRGGQEPRYVFNGVISTQQEAFELLQLIAQVFQGFTYWSSGSVTATQDRPADPVLLVTEANVIDGDISYSSSGRRARHTVAIVAWNDPTNLYKQEFEVVEATELDPSFIARYGYNPVRIDVIGCTSRGQAHRAGLWKLFTELNQTQIITYRAGLDHAVARPGDVVAVQDPQIANIDLSGRLIAGNTTTTLYLDRPVLASGGGGYRISVVMPDGTVSERVISAAAGNTITLSSALGTAPDPAAVWVIAGPISPRQFRIISIREEEPHIYSVMGIQHQPAKYATIDTGAKFEELAYSTFPNAVAAPTNVSARESQYTELGQAKQALTLSWTAGDALTTSGYYVTAVRPTGAIIDLPKRTSATADFLDVDSGEWTFFITAYGLNGKLSTATTFKYTVTGWAGQAQTTVANLTVKGGGSTFSGRSCTMVWSNTVPATVSPYPVVNVVYVYDASTSVLLHREILPAGQAEWTYDYLVNVNEGGPRRQFRVAVSAQSATGAEGPQTSLTVSNPAPAKLTPQLQATTENIFINNTIPNDTDFVGFLIWVSTTSGFTPTDANITVDTPSTFATVKAVPETQYYVRTAAYDAFSKNAASLNISDEYAIKSSAGAFDATDPGIPQNLTLSTASVVGTDGTITASITGNWTAITASNLGLYEVGFAVGATPADGDFIAGNFVNSNKITRQGFVPGVTYAVRVRSISLNQFGRSGWSTIKTIVAAANSTPPGPVTNLQAVGAVKNAFVTWANPTNADFAYCEVYSGSTTTFANATKLATVAAPSSSFVDPNLPDSGTRYYWGRSFNSSNVGATTTVGPVGASPGALPGSLIVAATIAGDRLLAGTITATQIASGTITADRIATGVLTADTITVGNGSLTSLFNGTNTTTISGTAISANSINANRLRVGSRGVSVIGCEFQWGRDANGAYTNVISWTSGNLFFNNDSGVPTTANISAGSATFQNAALYIYWDVTNSGVFSAVSNDWTSVYNNPNRLMICLSFSVGQLMAVYGGTIIDGTKITTLSIDTAQLRANAITADKIVAGAISTDKLAANSITADKIAVGAVTANKIGTGTLTAGVSIVLGTQFYIENNANGPRIRITNNENNQNRLVIGELSGFSQQTAGDYGIYALNGSGTRVFQISTTGIYMAGAVIGDLEVSTIKVANGAITFTEAQSSTAASLQFSVTNRVNGSRYKVEGFFVGSTAENVYLAGTARGKVYVEYSTGGAFSLLESIDCAIAYLYAPNVSASYKIFLPTVIATAWKPSFSAGQTITFRIRTDNGAGNQGAPLGGLFLTVTELAK